MKRALLVVALAFVAVAAAIAADPWDAATVRAGDGVGPKRFIPVELFTGAAWDGTQALTLAPVSTTVRPGNDPPMSLSGPVKSDKTGALVYERDRTSRRTGRVYQQFAINPQGDGIAMVYQERGGRVRQNVTASKFPLGWWNAGETRRYADDAQTGITILELDFPFDGIPHSLKFRWATNLSTDGIAIYVFSPNRGLVSATAN
jgi:hypothetical protein